MFKSTLYLLVIAAAVTAGAAFGQPASLAEKIMDADEGQFAFLFPMLKEQGDNELPALIGEIDRKLPPDANDDEKEKLAKRQANAAVALLKSGQSEKVWPLLKHSPDPRIRSYLIHRMGPLGVDPKTIIKRLDDEPEITIRRALLMSLGEFDVSVLSLKDRKSLLPKLQAVYRTDTDPGLHAASEWLLRKWENEDWLKTINDEWTHDEKGRKKKFDGIEGLLNTGNASPQWYLNGQGQTMVVIPGPVEFMMGSPAAEGRKDMMDLPLNETQHKRRISRTFALSAKAVTVEQYQKSRPNYSPPVNDVYALTPASPVIASSSLQALDYCNWLSKQENIPADQWCFEIEGDDIKFKDDYLNLTGYRLSTEAEMDFSSRSGATTARYFGETEDLLPEYAWYQKNSQNRTWPVGRLKPNDLGLFDVQGNVFAWCHESYRGYSTSKGSELSTGQEDAWFRSANGRVMRGGSFNERPNHVRSAYYFISKPPYLIYPVGIRLARTIQPAPTTPKVGTEENTSQ